MKVAYEVHNEWLEMIKEFPLEYLERFIAHQKCRACIMSNGNFVVDAVCTLEPAYIKETNLFKVIVHIQDGVRMSDTDCDRIDILDSTDTPIIKIMYNRGTYIQELGTLGITVPLF